MRDTKSMGSSLIAAATILALGSGSSLPLDWPMDDIGWAPTRATKTPAMPRAKSTHKQNARKTRKGRK